MIVYPFNVDQQNIKRSTFFVSLNSMFLLLSLPILKLLLDFCSELFASLDNFWDDVSISIVLGIYNALVHIVPVLIDLLEGFTVHSCVLSLHIFFTCIKNISQLILIEKKLQQLILILIVLLDPVLIINHELELLLLSCESLLHLVLELFNNTSNLVREEVVQGVCDLFVSILDVSVELLQSFFDSLLNGDFIVKQVFPHLI